MHEEIEKPIEGCTPEYCVRPEINKKEINIYHAGQEKIPADKKDDKIASPDIKSED